MEWTERQPSQTWSFLKYKGVTFAEVWFKPDGEPHSVVFRVRRSSFELPGISQRLTMLTLLNVVEITPDQIESLRYGGFSANIEPDINFELSNPLPQPPNDATHLEIHVRLKPLSVASSIESADGPKLSSEQWEELEASWKAILGLEATIESTRKNVEAIRAELEASMRMTLSTEDKTHALAADVAQWSKAKNRAHYAVPKANEFIHRATWAEGVPERKMLGELFKNSMEDQSSIPPVEQLQRTIEILRKDRQVLLAQGNAVSQECKNLIADVQSSLSRLQSNAMTRAAQKKGGIGLKRKSF